MAKAHWAKEAYETLVSLSHLKGNTRNSLRALPVHSGIPSQPYFTSTFVEFQHNFIQVRKLKPPFPWKVIWWVILDSVNMVFQCHFIDVACKFICIGHSWKITSGHVQRGSFRDESDQPGKSGGKSRIEAQGHFEIDHIHPRICELMSQSGRNQLHSVDKCICTIPTAPIISYKTFFLKNIKLRPIQIWIWYFINKNKNILPGACNHSPGFQIDF